MRITNRIFTYPVLSEEKTDYKNSVFSVDFEHFMDGVNSLKLTFDIAMTNPEIENLILNGQAEYVVHLECSITAYRQVIKSFEKHIEHSIAIDKINGTLEVLVFVISKKNINNFMNSDWDDDFDGMKFSLASGSILAYQNIGELEISKDINEFSSGNSIFTIYRRVTEEDVAFDVSLESSKIRIGLGSSDYDIYSLYAGKSELQQIFNSMVILPALVYVFEELKQDEGIDMYHNKAWFIALDKSYASRGKDFLEEVNSEKNSIKLAQEAMEFPISKAFSQIPIFYNFVEDDE